MDIHLSGSIERLEALLLSLREQVADLRERFECGNEEVKLEVARVWAQQQRLASELSARLFEERAYLLEERAYLLEVEHTTAPCERRIA